MCPYHNFLRANHQREHQSARVKNRVKVRVGVVCLHVSVGDDARFVLLAHALVVQHVLAVDDIGRRAVLVVVIAVGDRGSPEGVGAKGRCRRRSEHYQGNESVVSQINLLVDGHSTKAAVRLHQRALMRLREQFRGRAEVPRLQVRWHVQLQVPERELLLRSPAVQQLVHRALRFLRPISIVERAC